MIRNTTNAFYASKSFKFLAIVLITAVTGTAIATPLAVSFGTPKSEFPFDYFHAERRFDRRKRYGKMRRKLAYRSDRSCSIHCSISIARGDIQQIIE